jgi:RNA-directed DNA polymerase
MLFDNMLRLHNLPGKPKFDTFTLHDRNVVSGQRKRRTIHSPNKAMRLLHKRFLGWLRGRWIPLPNATGARKWSSPLKNVQCHQHNRHFYLLDIKNAYGHIDSERLASLLCGFDQRLAGQEAAMLEFLAYNFTENTKCALITGAPASPELYNHYAGILLDRDLQTLCDQYGLTYTRYIDDIAISSPTEPIGKRKRRAIRELIETASFPLNHHKARVCDLQQQPIVITGVGLQWKAKTFLPRGYLRRLRGLLHRALHQGGISKAKINGMMGVFWAVTSKYGMNATERKLVKQYRDTILALQF